MTSPTNRLLILGGGLFQTAFIEAAVSMDLEVITLDNLPGNPGHRLSHRYVNCSYTDLQGVLETVRRESIGGVAAFASDAALPAAALIGRELALPAPSPELVEVCVRKDRFRAFQALNGLPHPRFCSGSSWESVRPVIREWDFPLLFKPADASGSRGLTLSDSGGDSKSGEAFAETRWHSRCGVVCAEEYLPGSDLTAEGFLHNGRAELFFLTDKRSRGVLVKGHRAPAEYSQELVKEARDKVEAHWQALGYREGPFDADLRITKDRLVVLEMTPRLGGNGVPLIIDRCFGVNLVESAINLAMGRKVSLAPPSPPRGSASVNLGLKTPGRIKAFNSAETVKERVSAVKALYSRLVVGMEAQAHTHGGHTLAMAVFDCPRAEDFQPMIKEIEAGLGLETC